LRSRKHVHSQQDSLQMQKVIMRVCGAGNALVLVPAGGAGRWVLRLPHDFGDVICCLCTNNRSRVSDGSPQHPMWGLR